MYMHMYFSARIHEDCEGTNVPRWKLKHNFLCCFGSREWAVGPARAAGIRLVSVGGYIVHTPLCSRFSYSSYTVVQSI